MQIYGYYIDLNERGSFRASVRDRQDRVVYEIRAGNELQDDETSIFEDGFMRHERDVPGLESYLRDLGVISKDACVLDAAAFEAEVGRESALEAADEDAGAPQP